MSLINVESGKRRYTHSDDSPRSAIKHQMTHSSPKIIKVLCPLLWDSLFKSAFQYAAHVGASLNYTIPELMRGTLQTAPDTETKPGVWVHEAICWQPLLQTTQPSIRCVLNTHTEAVEIVLHVNRFGHTLQNKLAPYFVTHIQFLPPSRASDPMHIRCILSYADRHIDNYAAVRQKINAICACEQDTEKQSFLRDKIFTKMYSIVLTPQEDGKREIQEITQAVMNIVHFVNQQYINIYTLANLPSVDQEML